MDLLYPRLGVSVIGFLAFSVGAAAQSGTLLTRQQQEKVVATQETFTNRESAYRLAAISYAVRAREETLNPMTDQQRAFNRSVGGEEPVGWPLGRYLGVNRNALVGLDIKGVAEATAKEIDGLKIRGTSLEDAANLAVGLAALSKNPRVQVFAIAYPPLKNMAIRYIEREPRTPGLMREQAAEWIAWAMDQVRQGTATGKVLQPYVQQALRMDVRDSLEAHPAVKTASIELQLQQAAKTDAEILAVVKESLKQAKNWRGTDARRNTHLLGTWSAKAIDNTAGSLQLTAYVLDWAGHKKEARTVGQLAKAAETMSGLVRNGSEMATMMLVSGYVGVGIAVVSAFASANEPDPNAVILELLQQIATQIEEMRKEIVTHLQRLDQRIDNYFGQSLTMLTGIGSDAARTRIELAEIRKQLDALERRLTAANEATIGVLLRAQEDKCLRVGGNNRIRPLKTADEFVECREAFFNHAVVLSKEADAYASPQATVRLFPNGVYYKDVSQYMTASGASDGSLAEPSTWYRGAALLVQLIEANPKFFGEIQYDPATRYNASLDPVIAEGEKLSDFSRSAALIETAGGYRLNTRRFVSLIDQAFETRATVVEEVTKELRTSGLTIDPIGGVTQPTNPQWSFRTLAHGHLDYCDTIKPTFESFRSLRVGWAGGGSGYEMVLQKDGFLPGEYERVLADLNGHFGLMPASRLVIDHSLIKSMTTSATLREQAAINDAKVEPCISQLSISDYEHDAKGASWDLTIGVDVYVVERGRQALVQKLHGRYRAASKQGVTYSTTRRMPPVSYQGVAQISYDNRTHNIFADGWEGTRGRLDTILMTRNEGESYANRKVLEAELFEWLDARKRDLANKIKAGQFSSAQKLKAQLTSLAGLTRIGLQPSQESVVNWVELLFLSHSAQGVESLVDEIVLDESKPDDVRERLKSLRGAHLAAVNAMEQSSSLIPPEDYVAPLVQRLRGLTEARARLESGKAAPARTR